MMPWQTHIERATMTLDDFLRARLDEDAREIFGVDTDRQVAEVRAKRRIVERCERILRFDSEYGHDHADATDTLLDLASIYANHPDYREEWRP